MELDLTLLEDYFKRNNFTAALVIDLLKLRTELIVRILDGGENDKQVVVAVADITKILELNDVIGARGRIEHERIRIKETYGDSIYGANNLRNITNDLIYHTLAQYIAKMFGFKTFETIEIRLLERHKMPPR